MQKFLPELCEVFLALPEAEEETSHSPGGITPPPKLPPRPTGALGRDRGRASVFFPVQPEDLLLLLREFVCLPELDGDQEAWRQGAEPATAWLWAFRRGP